MPLLLTLAENDFVGGQGIDVQADVTEGLETEGVFHHCGVRRRTIDGKALDE